MAVEIKREEREERDNDEEKSGSSAVKHSSIIHIAI